MINLIKWLIWLYKHPLEKTTISFWERGVDIYIDGKKIASGDDKWHHVAVVAKDIPYSGWIDEIKTYSEK